VFILHCLKILIKYFICYYTYQSKETQHIIEKLKETVPEGKHELAYRLEELYSIEKNICEETTFRDGLKVRLLISKIVDKDI